MARELNEAFIISCDYNNSGYFLINRSTRQVKNLNDPTSDNRGCYDIKLIPNFDFDECPFVIAKGRKSLSLLNVKTCKVFEIIHNDEMQTQSFWEKMVVCSQPFEST